VICAAKCLIIPPECGKITSLITRWFQWLIVVVTYFLALRLIRDPSVCVFVQIL